MEQLVAGLGRLSLAQGSVQPSTSRNLRELLPMFTDIAHPPRECVALLEAFQFLRINNAPADASPSLGIADDGPVDAFLPNETAHSLPSNQSLPLDSAVNALEYGSTYPGPSEDHEDIYEDDSYEDGWACSEADEDALAIPDPLGYESDNDHPRSIPDTMSGPAALLVAASCGISAESMDAHLQYGKDHLAASNAYLVFDDDFSLIWPEAESESPRLEQRSDTDSWCAAISSDSASDGDSGSSDGELLWL